MNVVPKTGGNTFRGTGAFQFSNSSLQSDNYDDYLRSKLSAPSQILALYDVDFALGGPIKKDKLWFFYLGRTYGNGTSVTGMFANQECRQPERVDRIVPDPALQARNDGSTIVNSLRMTWQMSQKSKLSLFWDSQKGCNGAAWIGTRRAGLPRDAGRLDRRRHVVTVPDRARRRRVRQLGAAAHLAGDLDQHADEQDAVRVRLQRVQQPLGRTDDAGQPDGGLHPGPRAGRLDPGPLLPRDQHALRRRASRRQRAGSRRTRGTPTFRT